ncbi:hypothetical protein HF908_24125 (plasmid) [Ralstonia pseudosolanacearum]|uniref:Uncharacterized protein n=1 Tax=Ralstonia solanacearum TaxID=305 RepID=A0AA92Q931_RALSL|nr:hypothetical protein HF908_24125 [Ralstonia pseudosolanacearum]QOK99326.1 hypothetical protein HF909_23645 [Ralstonia pseudosolanacearum]
MSLSTANQARKENRNRSKVSGRHLFLNMELDSVKMPGVESRHLMERVEDEPFWFGCRDIADVFAGRQSLENFQAASKVVYLNEIVKVSFKLTMGFEW